MDTVPGPEVTQGAKFEALGSSFQSLNAPTGILNAAESCAGGFKGNCVCALRCVFLLAQVGSPETELLRKAQQYSRIPKPEPASPQPSIRSLNSLVSRAMVSHVPISILALGPPGLHVQVIITGSRRPSREAGRVGFCLIGPQEIYGCRGFREL